MLDGGESADDIEGGVGSDRLTGGEGDDTFFFYSGSGVDRITDFSVTNDKIGILNVSGVDDFDDLRIRDNANGDAVISWNDGGTTARVTLLGVSSSSLSTDDFFFG